MTAPVTPAPVLTVARSPLPFFVMGAAAIVFGVANAVGSQFFPNNAPVEQIIAFGFTVDFVAVLILAIIGVLVARQPFVVRDASVLSFVGGALTVLVLAIVGFTWVMGLSAVASGNRLHYSDETWMGFLFAAVWITGLAFCGFAYRRGGTFVNNLVCWLGIGFGLLIMALGALSAVLYGLGLTT